MPDPGFVTTAQATRERAAQAERLVERLKRALDLYIDRNGFAPRSPVGNYCAQIGLGVRTGSAAGVEYEAPPVIELARAIERTSMPSLLKRHFEGEA